MDLSKMAPLDLKAANLLVFHHCGSYGTSTVESINRFHRKERGWSGIGYHFFIDRRGVIWEGRPLKYRGAHASGVNHRSIGVCMDGDLSIQWPSPEQEKAAFELAVWACVTFGLTIVPHRLVGLTDCPGAHFMFGLGGPR